MGKIGTVFLLGAVISTAVLAPVEVRRDPAFADIAPIVFAKCSPCHNASIEGIPKLSSHKDFKSRRTIIARTVSNKFMPYCRTYSEMAQTCRIPKLTEAERVAVTRWCLFTAENEPDTSLAAREHKRSWTMGTPSRIFRVSGERSLQSRPTTIEWKVKASFHKCDALTGFDLLPESPLSLRFAKAYATIKGGADVFLGEWSLNAYAWRIPRGHPLANVTGFRLFCTYNGSGRAADDIGLQLGIFVRSASTHDQLEWTSFTTNRAGADESFRTLQADLNVAAISVDAPSDVTQVKLTVYDRGSEKVLYASNQAPVATAACNFVVPVKIHSGAQFKLRCLVGDGRPRPLGTPCTVKLLVLR